MLHHPRGCFGYLQFLGNFLVRIPLRPQVYHAAGALVLLLDDLGGDTGHHSTGRHIADDHSTGGHHGSFANPAAFQKGGAYLARFAFATDVALTEKYTGTTDGVVTVVTPAARGFIPMMELIDREKELKRLHKELEKAEKEANMFRNQLNNPKFVERAPEKLVNETRTKLAASEDKIANINQSIQALG